MAGFEGNDHHRRYNRWLRTPGEAEGKVVHSFFKLLEGCRMDPFLRESMLFVYAFARTEGGFLVRWHNLPQVHTFKEAVYKGC